MNDDDRRISVIIPTFNRGRFVGAAVDSVLLQGVDDVEIIVVDDGSTDDTRDVLKAYSGKINYIYQENRGVSAARNRGVRESRGNLLAFLDSDDIWAPGKLKKQLDTVHSDDILSFQGVDWFVDREEDRELLRQREAVRWPRCDNDGYVVDPVLDVATGRYLHLGTMLCRKSTFLEVGMFDEDLSMGEDEDWFSRASLKMRFHYMGEPLLKRRFHSQQTPSESEKSLRSLINVFSKIKSRTEHVHRKANVAAKRRLAAKWSHLANVLQSRGRHPEAVEAARAALLNEPANFKRLIKTAFLSISALLM
jgi:glycosyltransferase involved in cell wall biosynthesis